MIRSLHSKGILEICEGLHMRKMGTGPDLSTEEVCLYIEHLNECLSRWKDPTSDYDRCVQRLILATLAEWEPT